MDILAVVEELEQIEGCIPGGQVSAKLQSLHDAEEQLRWKALEIVAGDERLRLHAQVVERAMDLAHVLHQFQTDEEDLKLVQLLGMRTFNAFGAGLKPALSGYSQNSALILRDVLETVFLLDYFRGDRSLIERWRVSDKRARMREFSPVKVRDALDARDKFTSRRRAELYGLFSELAGHPTMKSAWMMRPEKDGDAVIGPFIEATTLEAVLSEMGRLAIQVGEMVADFIPAGWAPGLPGRIAFANSKAAWIATFYPKATDADPALENLGRHVKTD
jgi:hypothetical protein